MRRVHVFVHGNVQGVFFRDNTKRLAGKLSVNGFVRNANSGVEAVFEGPDDAIEKMLEFCRHGPPDASVQDVHVHEEKYKKEFNSFEIR